MIRSQAADAADDWARQLRSLKTQLVLDGLSDSSIFLSGTLGYDWAVQRPNETNALCDDAWWAPQPAMIVQPRGTEDVALLVRRLGHWLPHAAIAVRGGAHSYRCQSWGPPGAQHSIMVDTQLMRGIDVHQQWGQTGQAAVGVGAGVLGRELVEVAGENGLYAVHGDCPGVGILGCYLHGCIHFDAMSAKHGLGVDNIVGFTIVLMDGRVLNVTAAGATECDASGLRALPEQPPGDLGRDLWFAVRGAGSSFGIVTHLLVRAFPGHEPQVLSGLLSVPLPAGEAAPQAEGRMFAKLIDAVRKVPEAWSITVLSETGLHDGSQEVAGGARTLGFELRISYIGGGAPPEGALANISRLFEAEFAGVGQFGAFRTPNATSPEQPVSPYTLWQDSYASVWGNSSAWGSAGAVVRGPVSDQFLAAFAGAMNHLETSAACRRCWIATHRIGQGHRQAAASSGTSLSPVRASAEFYFEMECGAPVRGGQWERCDAALGDAQRALNAAASADDAWQYGNIPNPYSADWARYHWGTHRERLEAIKKELDPERRLRFFQSVGDTTDPMAKAPHAGDLPLAPAARPLARRSASRHGALVVPGLDPVPDLTNAAQATRAAVAIDAGADFSK